MKKLFLQMLSVCIFLALIYVSPLANAADDAGVLSFTPADVVFSDDGSTVYLSDKTAKRVYSVDTETFEQKSLSFDLMPETLYFKDGKLYVSLCTQAHSSYWWESEQSGAIAVIDCETFTKAGQFSIGVDPYDIVVSDDDIIYVASGSGQWDYIYGFNQNGESVAKGQIRQMSTIKYNPTLNRIYSITSDSSPRNMSAFVLKADGSFEDRGGNMGTSYGWAYHGDYSMGTTFHISPNGAHIFNSSGNVFTCDAERSNDMKFKLSLNNAWTDLAFDESGTNFYTALSNSKQIYAYDYGTFEGTATYETQGYAQYVFVKGSTLVAVSSEAIGGGNYFIETVNLSAPQSTIETKVTKQTLSYEENGCLLLSARSNVKTTFNGDVVYIADSADNAVYSVNTSTLEETKITFPNTPNSLYYEDGELIVGFGTNGIVVILDAETFEVKERLLLGTAFYDVAMGKDGYIYIIENFGSSAFSYARSFSRTTGQQVSNAPVYPRNGKFVPHPEKNMFYWADTGVSPQDINALVYENGLISSVYDSPYHGEYSIGSIIRISPDGKNIFTSSGSVFSSSAQATDMQYKGQFTSYADLVFDLPNGRMFASQSRANLIAYNYETFESEGFIKTVFPVKEMALNSEGTIVALSFENNSFYIERLNSEDILQVMPQEIVVSAGDTVFLATGGSLKLNTTLLYNDGTSKPALGIAEYESSDEDVADVDSLGRLQAKKSGHAELTITVEGLTRIIDVYVDFDITSISVDGYNIGFSQSQTFYMVILPPDTTEAPEVTYAAPEYVKVSKTEATELPGTTTLVVTDDAAQFSKTYTIYFYYSEPDIETEEMPLIVNGYFYVTEGTLYLSAWVEDNPDYIGVVPEDFTVVVQVMSFIDSEPVVISTFKNTREFTQTFSAENYAVIMVVDEFGQENYMGILLADPKLTW